jgi:hypothetical protein
MCVIYSVPTLGHFGHFPARSAWRFRRNRSPPPLETAASYFGRVPKGLILEAVSEGDDVP